MTRLLPSESAIIESARSFKEAAIRLMHQRGYTMGQGATILNPKGKALNTSPHYRNGYPQVTVRVGCRSIRVSVHRYAAFCQFGDAIFAPGVQVRHLAGLGDLGAGCLALGTQVENEADKAPEVRSRAAAIASQAHWERRKAGMLSA